MKNKQPTNGANGTLTNRQSRFVEQYLIDLNATAAYKRAGYTAKGRAAENAASRLLGNAGVRAAIEERLAASKQASLVTIEKLELELQRLALADIRRLYIPDGKLKLPQEWDDDTAATVAAVEVHEVFGDEDVVTGCVKKIKTWDKRAAIVDLLRRRDLAGKGEMGSADNPMTVRVIEIVRPATAPPPAADQGMPAP